MHSLTCTCFCLPTPTGCPILGTVRQFSMWSRLRPSGDKQHLVSDSFARNGIQHVLGEAHGAFAVLSDLLLALMQEATFDEIMLLR